MLFDALQMASMASIDRIADHASGSSVGRMIHWKMTRWNRQIIYKSWVKWVIFRGKLSNG